MDTDLIDRDSSVPRWMQIAAILRQRIAEHGTELTGLTDQELTREFGVSPLTVRQALQDLVRSGLLKRQRGKGTVVVQKPTQGSLDHFEATLSEWRVQGRDVRISLLERSVTAANMMVAAALDIKPGQPVGYMRRLRHADGHPVSIDYRYIAIDIFERLDDTDLVHETVWETIERSLKLPTLLSNTAIRATAASEEEAQLLNIPSNSPVLLRESQLIGADHKPMVAGRSIYHPERFIYATTIRR